MTEGENVIHGFLKHILSGACDELSRFIIISRLSVGESVVTTDFPRLLLNLAVSLVAALPSPAARSALASGGQ